MCFRYLFQEILEQPGDDGLKMRVWTLRDWLHVCCNNPAADVEAENSWSGLVRAWSIMFRAGSFLCDVNSLELPEQEEFQEKGKS